MMVDKHQSVLTFKPIRGAYAKREYICYMHAHTTISLYIMYI